MASRFNGKVSRFYPTVSRGYILFQGEEFPFTAKDVSNYDRDKLRTGLKVQFEIERTHKGRRAKDVMVQIPAKEMYLYTASPDDMDWDERPRTTALDVEPAPETTSESAEMIAIGLFGRQIRLITLSEDGTYRFLDDQQRLHNLLYVVSPENIRLEIAIEELESLMNSPRAKESDFQQFFERNPEFILNNEYRHAHSQVVLSRERGKDLRPDFLLEPIDQASLCDLLELKLPASQVFVLQKNRPRFSSAVYEARAQLLEYSRFFDEERNRQRFQSAYPGLMVYKPRMIVVIGRTSGTNAIVQRQVQTAEPDLILKTYDEVLLRMKWRIERARKKNFPE
jgi:hypothetical protein